MPEDLSQLSCWWKTLAGVSQLICIADCTAAIGKMSPVARGASDTAAAVLDR